MKLLNAFSTCVMTSFLSCHYAYARIHGTGGMQSGQYSSRNLNSYDGSCNRQCSDDSECVFVGGPNPCRYCNQGTCSKEPPKQGTCGKSCFSSNDCIWVGGKNDCQYCNSGTCSRTKPQCDSSYFCYNDSDCDSVNGCVCIHGHYGQPNHCGPYKT